MTEAIIISLFFIAVIAASYLLNGTIWHRCPKCGCYHSELGIIDKPPTSGRISTVTKKCGVCE